MNDQPDRNGWDGTQQERMPALAPDSQAAAWTQPPAGYSDAVSGYALQEESNFVYDLWRYFWILFRHRWVVLGITGFFVCVGLLVTLLSTPIYRASATMQIDREPAKILNVQEVQADIGSEAAFYATQYEILKSRSLAEQVVSNLSVAELEAFARHDVVSLWAKLRRRPPASSVEATRHGRRTPMSWACRIPRSRSSSEASRSSPSGRPESCA